MVQLSFSFGCPHSAKWEAARKRVATALSASCFPEEIVWGLYECEAHGTWPIFQDDSRNLYFYASLLCHSLMFSNFSGAISSPGLFAPKEELEDTVWDLVNALTTHVVS